jgi:ABC-type transport system involved in cytochrome c biogenesis permease subunit
MTRAEKKSETHHLTAINKFMYTVNVLLCLYCLVISRDMLNAMSNLGLALIFDPFDHEVRWQHRPVHQRVWLLTHVVFMVVLLGIVIGQKLMKA